MLLLFILAKCVGKFINPLTDINWACLFPITIGGRNVTPSKKDYDTYGGSPFCSCPGVPPKFGIKVTFFEPTRLVDVTRIPYCLVGLGGISLSDSTVKKHGTVRTKEDSSRGSFYNVHWYIYPLIFWLELLTDFECIEKSRFDVAYMSEFDPTWNDDEWSWLQDPEAGFFASPPVQLACVTDCLASSVNAPINQMHPSTSCFGARDAKDHSIPFWALWNTMWAEFRPVLYW